MVIKQFNYNKFAKYYDIIEFKEEKHKKIIEFLDRILRKYKVKSVLDITCGTGSQAICLSQRGYDVTASDISNGMLAIAKKKAKGLEIKFYQGDIRTSKFGEFDAVIAIHNAICHLEALP